MDEKRGWTSSWMMRVLLNLLLHTEVPYIYHRRIYYQTHICTEVCGGKVRTR